VTVDNPPSVSITFPADGALVSGTVNIQASASDDDAVVKVEFYIDGLLKSTDNTSPYSYSWDTTTYSKGTRKVKAIAYDSINQTNSHEISVTVDNPPSVSITFPADGALVSGTVNIQASASDDDAVVKVEFYIDDLLKHTDNTSPYSYSWDTRSIYNGDYKIKVIAYDTVLQTNTHEITIIVLLHSPLSFTVNQVFNRSLLQGEYINVLSWKANPNNVNIMKYRIYKVVGQSKSLLVELNADTFEYWHRGVDKDEQYSYALCAVDNKGREGEFAYTAIQGTGVNEEEERAQVAITAKPESEHNVGKLIDDKARPDNPVIPGFVSDINSPVNFSGKKVLDRSLFKDKYINILSWQANPNNQGIVKYRVYQVELKSKKLLVELNADTFEYKHEEVEKDKKYKYALIAVNNNNRESEPIYIEVR
jgi:hypothetical protein